ncbi:MAG: aminotransferase class V-fold PLP-dependent enzyme [Phycisphaeraceae bacterium]|nr:MAG: aminotransferase class V-fold PLP-dependent enzyme [Phycisphaeraceae bacterium]
MSITPRESELSEPHAWPSGPKADDPIVWPIEPGLTMLNHGSYGITPAYIQYRQSELRARMDADPVRFFKVELEELSDRARRAIAAFVKCDATDLALVPNATFAVATVLNSVAFEPGDEIVVTDHEYNATLNELGRICARTGAVLRYARVPLPLDGPDVVVDAVLGQMSAKTRLVIVSHIASASALVFPVERIVQAVRERGVDILVDGAHAPGQIPLDIRSLGATYYTGSCHKWLNTPKGSGFVHAERGKQETLKPLALSCRVHEKRADRKAFLCDFDYVGTGDYTANLVIPDVIEHIGAQLPGGWGELMRRNHDMVIEGASLVRDRCGLAPSAPDDMYGTMYAVLLPEDPAPGRAAWYEDPIWDAMRMTHGIQVPVWTLRPAKARLMRLSAQLYNEIGDFEKLAVALGEELERERAI